jgi:hypothetical protein
MFVSAYLTPDDQSDCPAAVSGDPNLRLYHSQQYRSEYIHRLKFRQMIFSAIYVNKL